MLSTSTDIRILVVERDIFARQAIMSYLSWDRHTRVIDGVANQAEMLESLVESTNDDRIDVIIMDTSLVKDAQEFLSFFALVDDIAPQTHIFCLATSADLEMAATAQAAGACAYMIRETVGIGIASAVRYALSHEFVITEDIFHLIAANAEPFPNGAEILPQRREYPRLTQRIDQALWLCVIEGLPAERAAEEMGVSVSTVRSYIKEGYRILEDEDDTLYPHSMSPAERAFQRYSALAITAAA